MPGAIIDEAAGRGNLAEGAPRDSATGSGEAAAGLADSANPAGRRQGIRPEPRGEPGAGTLPAGPLRRVQLGLPPR